MEQRTRGVVNIASMSPFAISALIRTSIVSPANHRTSLSTSAISKTNKRAKQRKRKTTSSQKHVTGEGIANSCRIVADQLNVHIEDVCLESLTRSKLTGPSMLDACVFMRTHGIDLTYRQELANSIKGLFSQRQGVYLVRLEMHAKGESWSEVITFNATSRLIFGSSCNLPKLVEVDCVSTKAALHVYREMFPSAQQIYQKSAHRCSLEV